MSAPIIARAVKIYGNAGNRRGELIAKPTALHVASEVKPFPRRGVVPINAQPNVIVLAVPPDLSQRRSCSRFGVIGPVTHFDKRADFGTLHIDGIPQQSRNHIGFKITANVQVILTDSYCGKRSRLTHSITGLHRGVNQELVGRIHRCGRCNTRLHQRVRLVIHLVDARPLCLDRGDKHVFRLHLEIVIVFC